MVWPHFVLISLGYPKGGFPLRLFFVITIMLWAITLMFWVITLMFWVITLLLGIRVDDDDDHVDNPTPPSSPSHTGKKHGVRPRILT